MPNTRKNRVKLIDIAEASGVSLTAVSLALNDKPGISPETRMRVMENARALGYRFKTSFNHAAAKSIKTIGLIVKASVDDAPHANHFYSHIIAGIEGTCRQMGFSLMFENLPVDEENNPLEVPALLAKNEVDGVLLAGMVIDDALGRILEEQHNPIVLIDSYAENRVFNSVVSDNHQGAYQATTYLIGKGHRHIGFIGGHASAYPSFRDRRLGYCEALADDDVQPPYFANCSTNREEISSAAVALIQQNPQITALVGVNDETAIYAMFALIEAGIRVPQDVSVIGFDDIYLAESVVPALTTMRVNKQSMGRLAVQLLANQVFLAEGGYVTSVFRPALIERGSVLSLPGNGDGQRFPHANCV
jgi:LacI family transcriptional regulator